MSIYDVNIKRLALLLLPIALRRPLMAAFAQTAVQGVHALHAVFMKWKGDCDYRLTHNGQVCHLRAALNDAFDPKERRIAIDDEWSNDTGGTTVYMRCMERSLKVPGRVSGRAIILNRRGFGGVSGYDFWVSVPYALRATLDETRLAAIVNKYKLASKRWTINYN